MDNVSQETIQKAYGNSNGVATLLQFFFHHQVS